MKIYRFSAFAVCLGIIVACGFSTTASQAAGLAFLEDPGEGDFNANGSLTVKSAKSLDLELAFNYQQDTKKHYLLTVSGGLARIQVISGGKARPLGNAVKVSLKDGSTVPFTLQRRQWRMSLVWDNLVVLRAYDPYLQDGLVGSRVSGGTLADFQVQPVGDMEMGDDFVREEGAQSVWQPVVGVWEARTLRDDQQAGREEADKSANAFSYFGSGDRAISIAGNWFWDRYMVESAIRPMGQGAIGLVFYYQNDKNYLLLRWRRLPDEALNALQLVAVRDGQEKVLGERAGAYLPGQWYKLRAQVCDGVVQCSVDDELLLQVETPLFGQGQTGLYVEGKAGAFFDDVASAEWELFRENFAQVTPGKWVDGTGWTQKTGVMTYGGAERALCVAGQNWERYTCAVDSTSTGGGTGLAFAYNGPKGFCVLRWAPAGSKAAYRGKVQLAQMTDKGLAVLAEKALPGSAQKHQLRVSVEDGLLTGLVDDTIRLQALSAGVTGGAIALYADGPSQFDNVRLSLVPLRKGSHITKEFAIIDKHPEMAGWASTKAPWTPTAEDQNAFWTKGDYFGETSVIFVIPAVGSKTGSCRATIGGAPGDKSGLTLTVSAEEKSKKLKLALTAADQPVKVAETEVEGDANILFSRESGLVVVRVNEQPVLTAQR
ncbi:MAG: hypothetical protein ABFE08_18180 [Armatimonadia bacterium]